MKSYWVSYYVTHLSKIQSKKIIFEDNNAIVDYYSVKNKIEHDPTEPYSVHVSQIISWSKIEE